MLDAFVEIGAAIFFETCFFKQIFIIIIIHGILKKGYIFFYFIQACRIICKLFEIKITILYYYICMF